MSISEIGENLKTHSMLITKYKNISYGKKLSEDTFSPLIMISLVNGIAVSMN